LAKKVRPDPLTEGSLMNIYQWFFAPLVHYKPAEMPIKDWMELLFDFRNRDIVRYVATKPFKMPGLFYQAANIKVQGMGYRKVAVGDAMWVRHDARNPRVVDIEVQTGAGDQVFQLTSSEFNRIGPNLREEEKVKK
jgi:hypothetical protein